MQFRFTPKCWTLDTRHCITQWHNISEMAEYGFLSVYHQSFIYCYRLLINWSNFPSYTRFGCIDDSSNKGKAVTLTVKVWHIPISKQKWLNTSAYEQIIKFCTQSRFELLPYFADMPCTHTIQPNYNKCKQVWYLHHAFTIQPDDFYQARHSHHVVQYTANQQLPGWNHCVLLA